MGTADNDFTEIMVLSGLRFTPEQFLAKMEKSRKLKKQGVICRYVTTAYGLCWIFQFRVKLQATQNTSRYIGYYAGFDETVMSPGKLALIPGAKPEKVNSKLILADRLTEAEALERAWDYNRQGIIRKYRILQNPPILEDHVTDRYYKPLYMMEFYNSNSDERKYQMLDSLTGDLLGIQLKG